MPKYYISAKDYSSDALTEFTSANVTCALNGPNSASFEYGEKFDATSVISLQKDVAITYQDITLFTGKVKEEVRGLSTGDERISYRAVGANLEEAYAEPIEPIDEKYLFEDTPIVLYANGDIQFTGSTNSHYIEGSIIGKDVLYLDGRSYNGLTQITGSLYCGSPSGSFLCRPNNHSIVIDKNVYCKNTVWFIGYNGGKTCKIEVGKTVNYKGSKIIQNIADFDELKVNFYIPDEFITPPTKPILDANWYKQRAHPSDIYVGNTTFGAPGGQILNPINGIVYVKNGDVTFQKGQHTHINGCLVIDAGYRIKSSTLYPTIANTYISNSQYRNYPALIGGKIYFSSVRLDLNGLIYMTNDIDFELRLNSIVRGAIITSGYFRVNHWLSGQPYSFTLLYQPYYPAPGLTWI